MASKQREPMDHQTIEQRALERAKLERIHFLKIAGENRYLARSRTVEPGAFYELTVSSWGTVRCNCPGYAYRHVCKHSAGLKAKLNAVRPSIVVDDDWAPESIWTAGR